MEKTQESIDDYLMAKDHIQKEDESYLIIAKHDNYRINFFVTDIEDEVKDAVFDPMELKVKINPSPEYFGDNVTAWIDYELGLKVATKHNIYTDRNEKSQFMCNLVMNPRDADNLISAVIEYDRLYNSKEMKDLRVLVPSLIERDLKSMLEKE